MRLKVELRPGPASSIRPPARSICSPTNGISDTRRVADPRVNVTRWWTSYDRVLYARIGTFRSVGAWVGRALGEFDANDKHAAPAVGV
jgi:hypothetical protein